MASISTPTAAKSLFLPLFFSLLIVFALSACSFDSSVQAETPLGGVSELEISEADLVEPEVEQSAEQLRAERVNLVMEYLAERDLSNSHVIGINIPTQTMWFYADGQIIWESPVVTGTQASQLTSTEPGIYQVGVMRSPWQLLYDQRSDYWIEFDARWGIGIHDAQWRTEFGGDIYLENGSHGCVNVPISTMGELYRLTKVGDTVWVHAYPELL